MASSIALNRLITGNLLLRSLRPLRSVTPVASSRLFNTNAAARGYEDDDDSSNRPQSYYGRREFTPFTDVMFSRFPPRSMSQILNMVDRFSDSDSPFAAGIRSVVRETDEGVHIKMDLPGLGKEDVKLSMQQNTLVIKGESKSVEGEDSERSKVSSRIELPEKTYKIDEIKAKMKNGVLKVFVPKVKEEERTDVFNVKVD